MIPLAPFLTLQHPVAEVTADLTDEVRAQDAALFKAVFDTCDIPTLKKIVADDLEFFHDKNGLVSTSAPKWVEGVAGMWHRQAKGTD